MAKENYLNNADLMDELTKSKASYSYFLDKRFSHYDIIVNSLDVVTPDEIAAAKVRKAATTQRLERAAFKKANPKASKRVVDTILYRATDFTDQDITIRLMTFDHIPADDTARIKNPKKLADTKVKLLFPPFKHFQIQADGSFMEVGRSHWQGGFDNGWFSQEHGRTSNKLAKAWMLLVERYGQRGNWRGYSYLDEMKSQALMQLCMVGLQFDESRSSNAFAYYTVIVQNAFTRILNIEKKGQNVRDDLLIMNGQTPSMTRQIDNSLAQRKQANGEIDPPKLRRGPKPKVGAA